MNLSPGLALLPVLLALGGCSTHERFTLEADLPPNFKLTAEARYAPVAGADCRLFTQTGQPTHFPHRSPDYVPEPRRVSFEIPLTSQAMGCPLVLRGVAFDIEGKWGELKWGNDWHQINGTAAGGLSVRDSLPDGAAGMPATGALTLNGECQWMFRTLGPKRNIRKLLRCRAVDEQGQWLKHMPGGAAQRDQLPGRTVRLVIGMASEELPAYQDTWIRLPTGWKRCMGKSFSDQDAFCMGNTTDFSTFTAPDGRTCTVYPNCTE